MGFYINSAGFHYRIRELSGILRTKKWQTSCKLSEYFKAKEDKNIFNSQRVGFNRGRGLLGLVNLFIPMPRSIKTIINVVIIVTVILWVLQAFGINIGIRIPRF